MSEEEHSEHHTTPRGIVTIRQFGPENAEKMLPDDTLLIDRQFKIWAGHHPAYAKGDDFVPRLLAEMSPNPAERPETSDDAKAKGAKLADFANDSAYSSDTLKNDPYEKVFATTRVYVQHNPQKLELVEKIERLYQHRQVSMSQEQQYTTPLPEDLMTLLQRIIHDE